MNIPHGHTGPSSTTSTPALHDELTHTVLLAAHSLSVSQKADFLLQTALDMIEAGRYGEEVEHYIEVFLGTPGVPTDKISKALLARAGARRAAADRLLTQAHRDFQALAKLDPSNRDVLAQITRGHHTDFSSQHAHCRVPPEIWELIASHIPRFHLRTWLYVSAFHRGIARRLIFRTVDIYFGDDNDIMSRGLDFFDRVKQDQTFAKLIRTLRIHWSYEDSDLLDLMKRIFREALPSFKALREFEWIGYPEMRADMVQAVLAAHPHLHGLGLIGWHFDAEGVAGFRDLRKFTLRAEDDDGLADMYEVRAVLDQNQGTLVHLTLGAELLRSHSWDLAFQSATVQQLTHVDLVDTHISHLVLTRITHAQNLRALTLHGTLERPDAAGIVFGSDHIVEGRHTVLPHLEAFRFIMVDGHGHDHGHNHEPSLFQNVVLFLRGRSRLRRLDLGRCPWDIVWTVLPSLTGLRVLRVHMASLTDQAVQSLVGVVPPEMRALHLAVTKSDQPMNTHARHFARFHALAMLHLACASTRRPQLNLMAMPEFRVHSAAWAAQARGVAAALPALDFVGWHREHYVVVRDEGAEGGAVELKELPMRRRLDCGRGVDLGDEDACWLERKDVPIDYEMSRMED